MAKVRTERTSKAKSKSGKWWSPLPLAFKTEKDELIEATSGNLTLTDAMFYTDVRTAVHDCWKGRTLPTLRGGLTIQARTTLPQAAIPPAVLSVVMSAFESGLQEVFAGAMQAEREVKTDFGDVAWSLRFAPNVDEKPDAADHSTVAHRGESGQTTSPGNKVAEGPGRDITSKDVTEEWQITPSSIREAIERALAGSPTDPRPRLRAIQSAKHGLMSGLAAAIQGPLQAVVDSMPSETREEKREICYFVNSTLRELGLAVRCPKTGRPASLIADSRSPDSDLSRFRYAVQDDRGRQIRTVSTAHLPPLEILEDEPRKEVFAKWAERVRQAKNNGRKSTPGD